MRADVVPEPHHVLGFLQQVLVDVFAEDDLFFHRDRGIEIHLQLARAFRPAGQLHAELFPGERLEVGGVTPELILLEGLACDAAAPPAWRKCRRGNR